jgi:large subunit ribosomal protein L32
MSRSNTRSRRANWKATVVGLTTCKQCKAPTQPHMACPSCGSYKGRRYEVAERSEHQG